MKRLVSKEERERLRKKNRVTVGVILVFLMVASTLGFAIQDNLGNSGSVENPEKVTYNGFEFSSTNGFWVFQNFVFRYNPKEVPDVGDVLKNIDEYRGKPVYIQSEDKVAGKTSLHTIRRQSCRSRVICEPCASRRKSARSLP